MSDQIKTLAPFIWSEIKRAQNILLHCHPSPDGDSLGSGLAMLHILERLGKNVTLISGDSQIPAAFESLPGFDQITTASFDQINVASYDLFIIQDVSDYSRITSKIAVAFPRSLKTVKIDHHPTGNIASDIALVLPDYQATCQVLYELIQEWPIEISPEIAANLYVGMYTDSVSFQYAVPSILEHCGKLLRINPEIKKIIHSVENSRTQNNIFFLGLALSNITTYFKDKVAVSVITSSQLSEMSLVKPDTENMRSFAAGLMISVKTWEIAICICEELPGKVVASLRSRDPSKYNVSTISELTGNGGGHPAASGVSTDTTPVDLQNQLLKIISTTYPDLGQP